MKKPIVDFRSFANVAKNVVDSVRTTLFCYANLHCCELLRNSCCHGKARIRPLFRCVRKTAKSDYY